MGCFRPVRRRKRKRRKRKRKTTEEDKANEGESSDEDSAAEGDEVVDAEEGSASEASHKGDSAEGNDQQGNLQCPPCRRQGGHITSLTALARAQFEWQQQMRTVDSLLAEQDIPQCASVDNVSPALQPLVGQSADAHVTCAFTSSDDTDSLLKACSEALMQKVASIQLDENSNNPQDCSEFVQKRRETVESEDKTETQVEDKLGKLSLINDDMMQCGHLTVLDSDSTSNVEALVDENVMQTEQLLVLSSDGGKTVTFSLQSQLRVSEGCIQAQSSDNRHPISDELRERQGEVLMRHTSVQDVDIVSGASGTAADTDDDGEVAEITANSSFSSLSHEVLAPVDPPPDRHPDAVALECNGSDEDKRASDSTVETLHDLCSVAQTDDEKWTERCEKSDTQPLEVTERCEKSDTQPLEVTERCEKSDTQPLEVTERCEKSDTQPLEVTERCEKSDTQPLEATAVVDRARRPKQRRRQNLEEKVRTAER